MTNTPTAERLDILEDKLDQMVELLRGKFPQEFLTVNETAELLRCSKSSVRDKIRNGVIPFSRLGESQNSMILIQRSDLMGLMK